MEDGVGVNSPEFLQKKVERLKTALDEANLLMDRHVSERDEARAQLTSLKHENEELRRRLADREDAQATADTAAPGIDPELEVELRARIAQLENDRASLESVRPESEQHLHDQIDSLQRELETTRNESNAALRELEAARADADAAGRELEAARADADAARRELEAVRADADAARRKLEDARVAADAADRTVQALRAEADAAQEDLDTARSESDSLRGELEASRTDADAARRELEGSRTDAIAARRELDTARAQAAEARRELETSRAEADTARRELEISRADADAARGELEDARMAADATHRELQASRAEADAARRELELSRTEADAARQALETSRADADAAREALESSRADTESARRDAEAARSDAEVARRDADAARTAAAAVQAAPAVPGSRPRADTELPAAGPFVSQEVIRDALDNDNFVLFCQPVFSLQAERITQYELLLRLRDADGRLVRPFGFLEPADRYGLMAEIDRWVVDRALDLLSRDSSGDLRLEVNLAAQSLGDPELTAVIEQHIAMTDLDPGRLILEVSENVAAANLDDVKRLAKRLRGLGCGFALDDFGSTFASFRHLRDIPLSFLKIDGDLVVTVTESRTGQLTVKSLVELAKGLGAETVAEYVSDDQTLEFLREQGVGYAQGYRIGRPRPIEEVLELHTAQPYQSQPPKRVEHPALGTGEDDEPGGVDEAHQIPEHAEPDFTPSETI